jgi:hypothetical protein
LSGTVKASTVNPDAPSWIFPSFVDMADGRAASKASCILKNLVDEVEGLTPGHTAHELCAWAANDMLLNKLCNAIGAIFWGNWELFCDVALDDSAHTALLAATSYGKQQRKRV